MPLREIKIFRRHGRQFIKDLASAELTPLFRGRPIISNDLSVEESLMLSSLCPVDAIDENKGSIDLGKCVFCKECQFALPEKIKFTNDHKIAANSRESLIIKKGQDLEIRLEPDKIRKEIRSFFKNNLKLRQVSAAGDNSTEMELNAAGNVNFDMGRYGIEFVASPRHADGIVITGPISVNMAKALQITYEAIPSPKIIILAGTDAIGGGIFAGSPALNREFLDKYPVDLYIPGNPVHPLTFILGVLALIGKK